MDKPALKLITLDFATSPSGLQFDDYNFHIVATVEVDNTTLADTSQVNVRTMGRDYEGSSYEPLMESIINEAHKQAAELYGVLHLMGVELKFYYILRDALMKRLRVDLAKPVLDIVSETYVLLRPYYDHIDTDGSVVELDSTVEVLDKAFNIIGQGKVKGYLPDNNIADSQRVVVDVEGQGRVKINPTYLRVINTETADLIAH